jgi:voltage-gated potassium channel
LNTWRKKLFIIIFRTDTPAGKWFDIILLWTILLSILVVTLESVNSFANRYEQELLVLEWLFTIIFTIEYLLRIFISTRPQRYVFSLYGMIDLLSVAPTYLELIFIGTPYFMLFRALRLLRVFRVLKLTRYLGEAEVLRIALKNSIEKIIVFLGSVLSLALIIGALMYVVEGPQHGFTSIPRGIYWAIVTLTTVGYGDIAPQTPLGQFLATMVMMIGYGIIAVPTGIMSVEISKAEKGSSKFRTCKNCGFNQIVADAKFCRNCGNELD